MKTSSPLMATTHPDTMIAGWLYPVSTMAIARDGESLPTVRNTRVFISYSRKDLTFAECLVAALKKHGFEAYLDKKDILPGEPWRERLGALILTADAVAFVISPDSIASDVCAWEVDETERFRKKLLPVLYRTVPDGDVPSRLSRLNYIFLRAEDAFDIGVATLATAINTDIAWIRQHTRVGELARRWEDAGRPAAGGRLMRGEELADAETWLLTSPTSAPDPTEAQRAYVQTSRTFETAEIARTRRTQKRAAWALSGVAALVLLLLGGSVWQDIETTRREQAVFTSLASKAMNEQRFDRALRLAVEGFPAPGSLPWMPLSSALEGVLAGGALTSRLTSYIPNALGATFGTDGVRLLTRSINNRVEVENPRGAVIPLIGHQGEVNAAQFSPDGRRIVTASADATVRIWDALSGKEILVLQGHKGGVSAATFNSDGTRVVTQSEDRSVRLWNARTGKQISAFEDLRALAVELSPNGKQLMALTQERTIVLFDAESARKIVQLSGHDEGEGITDAKYNSDGTRIVTASEDDTARIWNASTGKLLAVLRGHDHALLMSVESASFNRQGTRVVTTSGDKTARVWDASSGRELVRMIGHDESVQSAEFSPDGTRVVTASKDKTARVWDADTGGQLLLLIGHEDQLRNAKFSPDGTQVITTTDNDSMRVWDISNGKGSVVYAGHKNIVHGAAFSPDATLVITASADSTARLWEASTGKEVRALSGHVGGVFGARFSPDGSQIVTASEDDTARIWDASNGTLLRSLKGHEGDVFFAAFSPDGTRVVTGSDDHSARIWNASDGKELVRLKGHGDRVNRAEFSPDGKRVVTASWDNSARVWDATSGEQKALLKGHRNWVWSAAFSPDGTRVVTGSYDYTARVWDAESGKELVVLTDSTSPRNQINTAAFSPDGRRIITASEDGIVRLWDARTGQKMAALKNHIKGVLSAEFSPHGTQVVTASWDATASVRSVGWATKFYGSELRARVCVEKLLNVGDLTDEELRDPALIGIDRDDPVARNPCLRRGPLHWEYYTQVAVRLGRWIGARW